MKTSAQEIPREQWHAYFDLVNDQYEGWGVTIEVLGGELGDQPAANGLPLQGISFERKGSRAGDILIDMGDEGTPVETHTITRPRTVRAANLQPGAEADVQIESEDGTTTLVRLWRRPELPPASKPQAARADQASNTKAGS